MPHSQLFPASSNAELSKQQQVIDSVSLVNYTHPAATQLFDNAVVGDA
jgi:hypothetical protein